ncbi:unnamed protein product [Leptidea sinapis]|uniref:Uncharacterized protein n=2 Tax=Leptidea sinapis TaxID=189913 RepID=A0A5E4PRD7_9NEOP|nr:unnamed protein product [Leptidea sinapis]
MGIMDYFSGWCKSKRRLDGLTVVVTGANAGIGKETALDLYDRGAKVIMACRNTQKAEEARSEIISKSNTKSGCLVIESLDLSRLKSVKECARRILEREEEINILINNAGVIRTHGRTEDGFEKQIGVNYFGHAMFTLLLLPRIIRSAPARIVNVSSMSHKYFDVDLDDINMERTSQGVVKSYGRSKSAIVLFTKALHLKLREHGINNVNTYSLHPGSVQTDIARDLFGNVIIFIFKYIGGAFVKQLNTDTYRAQLRPITSELWRKAHVPLFKI